MTERLDSTVAEGFAARYTELSQSVAHLAKSLTEEQFWQKPFSFGNSFGHLVLHLTGNLNFYIGAEIAGTGYIRDRDREFTEANRPSKAEALEEFRNAVAMVVDTIKRQTAADWAKPYTAKGEDTAGNLSPSSCGAPPIFITMWAR